MNHSVSTKYGIMRLASSHLKTHVSLLSLRLTEEKGLFEPFEAHWLYDGTPLCIRNWSCGIISLQVSQREDKGHTLELIQTSGIQEHKLLNEAAIWIEIPVFHGALESIKFPKAERLRILSFSFLFSLFFFTLYVY